MRSRFCVFSVLFQTIADYILGIEGLCAYCAYAFRNCRIHAQQIAQVIVVLWFYPEYIL